MDELDCKNPPSVAETLTNKVMVDKANASFLKLCVLGILAGVYIGFGAEIATLVAQDAAKYVGFGLAKILSGALFSVGLMIVVIAGAELFTGNVLIVLSCLEKKTTLKALFRNWIIVYFANFAGSLLLVLIIFSTKLWQQNDFLFGATALKIAAAKVNLSFVEAFTRGILCNWLVCLAIWMAEASRKVIGKIFAIFFPIMIFVALGFEHSVANMFFIPKGIILKTVPEVVNASGLTHENLAALTSSGFLQNNLIPVTLGNIVGATVFVAFMYWLAYREA